MASSSAIRWRENHPSVSCQFDEHLRSESGRIRHGIAGVARPDRIFAAEELGVAVAEADVAFGIFVAFVRIGVQVRSLALSALVPRRDQIARQSGFEGD